MSEATQLTTHKEMITMILDILLLIYLSDITESINIITQIEI